MTFFDAAPAITPHLAGGAVFFLLATVLALVLGATARYVITLTFVTLTMLVGCATGIACGIAETAAGG